MNAGVSECSRAYYKDFMDLETYRATRYRYSDIDRTIAGIHAIKKRRIKITN